MRLDELHGEQMTLTCRRLPAVTVIKVDGEVDLATADTLQERSRQACRPGDQVIFDLTETTFLDCSGVRALLRVREHARRQGGTVRLSGLRSGPAKIIAISGLAECLPVHNDLNEALRIACDTAAGNAPDENGPLGGRT